MADRLRQLGYETQAQATERLIPADPSEGLRDLWHAVEWLDSLDYGPDEFAKAAQAALERDVEIAAARRDLHRLPRA